MATKRLRIALVHDFLTMVGGAEKVVESILDLPHDFILYTSVTDQKEFHGHKINTTFIQKLPFWKQFLVIYKNLLPVAFEHLRFDPKTDLIISSTASFAKNIIPPSRVKHISYIHTPPRFLWNLQSSLKVRSKFSLQFIFNFLFGTDQRILDFWSAQRVHTLIANSRETQLRIQKFYKRDSIVIHPAIPVQDIINKSENYTTKKDSYLIFGRVEAYKNIENIIDMWPDNLTLTIAGTGTLLPSLQQKYAGKSNISFLGFVPEAKKIEILSSYKALIYPNREDFGIVMVEALACGTPVISLNQGGAVEIVEHTKTGYLMEKLDSTNLTKALEWAQSYDWSIMAKQKLQSSVLKFDIAEFNKKFEEVIENNI